MGHISGHRRVVMSVAKRNELECIELLVSVRS